MTHGITAQVGVGTIRGTITDLIGVDGTHHGMNLHGVGAEFTIPADDLFIMEEEHLADDIQQAGREAQDMTHIEVIPALKGERVAAGEQQVLAQTIAEQAKVAHVQATTVRQHLLEEAPAPADLRQDQATTILNHQAPADLRQGFQVVQAAIAQAQ